MECNKSLYYLITSFLLCSPAMLQSQNLFANPGFEDINRCTEHEYYCNSEAWFNIPPGVFKVKQKSAPEAKTGTNILLVPVENFIRRINSRHFVYTMLCCPLQKDKKYRLAFYVNSSKRKFYHLDFYFTDKEPLTAEFNAYNKTPSIIITENNLAGNDKSGWKKVDYEFTASGTEKFCVLGNFSKQLMEYNVTDVMSSLGEIYYFIDDIALTAFDSTALCENYSGNIKKIYEQNYRHTDNIKIVKDTPVIINKAAFITDTITVPAIFFETGSAAMKPAFTKLLDSISIILAAKKITKIEIIGHTDNAGTVEKNETLSLARADAVKKYLFNKLPQYSDNIFAFGKGQRFPVADNNTEADRAKNRRVEIVLTRVKITM